MARLTKPSLVVQVVAGMVLGIALGHFWPEVGVQIKPLSDIFLRMIKMLIAPLIFATLVIGIAGTGSHKNLGRLGAKTLIYFELATIPALIIGMVVANLLRPGDGIDMSALSAKGVAQLGAITGNIETVQHHTLWDTLVNMVPTSVIDAMARGDILQLVVFSVFFALAILSAGEKARPILGVLQSLSEIMFEFVNKVMAFAPMGVMAAIAATVGANGLKILLVYAKLVGALYFALGIFVLLVLCSACAIARIPFLRLMKAIKEPFLLAFSTASSESALPKAMEVMERFGVPKNVVSFVMPTGYSFNLDGSTLYVALAALFVAQMAHVEMSLQSQLVMLLTLILTTKGVAAVPKASLVVLAATLSAFHLPMEGVAVILGIDHFLDMGRTSINLVGNCVASAVVARWEGVFDDDKMNVFGTENEVFEEETVNESIRTPLLV
ncbi:dicarboxylate/amino acid:cation symporter [Vampirovibrio chlorellavorus]|uniref:dicarboxylate/amino acid:cation symporter n=1 Tax=Vampirovibrio chlorellavorus TaxID=758823 RepID=UPI0026EAD7D2|nr:cation:dicarboxylase symporter family transporter [Vampirovibrio chlorellavorus]